MKLYKILENFDKVESATDKLTEYESQFASDDEIDGAIQANEYEGIRDQDGWETLELTVHANHRGNEKLIDGILNRLSIANEDQTKVQTMGNKVKVTTGTDTTEFDDAETAAAFMGTEDDKNQFATEGKMEDDEAAEAHKPWEKDDDTDDEDDDDDKETVNEGGIGDDWDSEALDTPADDVFGDWFNDDNPDDLLYDPATDTEFARDALPEEATCEDGPEFATFDSENEAHRKRLQRGTPVVLSPELFTDPDVNRRGIFVSRSPGGDFARVIRDLDGKEIKVHLSDIKSADLVNNSVYEEYELSFDAMLSEDEDKEKKEKWGVYMKGGSIGGKKDDSPVKTFDNRPDAMADAKRRRKGLSAGEKGYYKMGYSVKKINEATNTKIEKDIKGLELSLKASNLTANDKKIIRNKIKTKKKQLDEDITMTQTTNMDNPENDTTTVTAVGAEAGEELAAMMANAGLNTGEYASMDAPPIDAGEVDTGEAEPVEMPMGDMIGMMDEPVEEAFGFDHEKPLQKELIVYPNITFDRSQAVRLPPGTMVDFARGGDDYRNNVAKIVAADNVWFTWNDDYYEALSDRIKEGDGDWVDGWFQGEPGDEQMNAGPSDADLDSIDADPEWELDFDMDEPLREDDIAYLSNEIAQAVVDGADIYELIHDESVPPKDREGLQRDIDELMLGGDNELTAYENLAQRIYDMYADADMNEERDIEYSNTPDELEADVDMVTHGTSGGLNRPKRMYKPAAGGDNAMQRPMKEDDLDEELSPKMQARKKADRERAEVDFDMSRRSKGSRLRGKGRGTGRDDRSVRFGLGEEQTEEGKHRTKMDKALPARFRKKDKKGKKVEKEKDDNKLVNEHESVDSFLDLYKTFTIRTDKK